MNDYNRKISDKNILNHPTIKRMIAKMPEGLNDIEKARYIYLTLGKIFTMDANYILGNSKMRSNLIWYVSKKPINLDNLKVKNNKYRGLCVNISEIYGTVMASLQVRSAILEEIDPRDPHKHAELWIDMKKINPNTSEDKRMFKLPTDLQKDLINIQMHRHTKFFGVDNDTSKKRYISDEEIEKIDKKLGFEYDGEILYKKIVEEYKEESKGLNDLDRIELFFKKVEDFPYINELGIVERKVAMSDIEEDMLSDEDQRNFFKSFIFKKGRDIENRKIRKSFIPIYSYRYRDENKIEKYARYYYDKNEKIHYSITDDELSYFIGTHGYDLVNEIPGLQEYNESIKLRLFNRKSKKKKKNEDIQYNNTIEQDKDDDGFIRI